MAPEGWVHRGGNTAVRCFVDGTRQPLRHVKQTGWLWPVGYQAEFPGARYVAISDPLLQTRQSYRLTGICVVVIDDDPLTLECMNEMIHRWGCTVVACANYKALERGLYLMRKPLAAMTLRTVMNRLLEKSNAVCTCEETDLIAVWDA